MQSLSDLGQWQKPLATCSASPKRSSQLPSQRVVALTLRQKACLGKRGHTQLVAAQSSGLTSSVQLGPTVEEGRSGATQNGAVSLDAVELNSEAGQDYSVLRDALQSGEFQTADDETRAVLIRLAGPEAEKRGWVYFTEVKFIPEADLQTIDNLWRAASSNKFGYSVQKEVWIQNRRRWDKFFQKIDWVQGKNNVYRKWPKEFTYGTDAVKGHLPLTNALRGTQLFKAIMEHPAFNKQTKNSPDWLS